MSEHKDSGKLSHPKTIRKLWWGFSIVLALTVFAQLVVPIKGYFDVDSWLGFGAIYGFLCCLMMVLFAKGLGLLLKRPNDYYREEHNDDA